MRQRSDVDVDVTRRGLRPIASFAMSETSSYTALPVHVPGRIFGSQLFVRPHVSRTNEAELPPKRTLFVLNLPPSATADMLADAFKQGTERPEVFMREQGQGSGQRSAHLVFPQPSALKRALAAKKPLEFPPATPVPIKPPRAPKREDLRKQVASVMEQFEAAEREQQREQDAMHNQMDDDGFVLVTRKRTGRNTSTEMATGATVGVASASAHDVGDDDDNGLGPRKKKKKPKDMADFYHFQQHEKKREQLLKLREQFEQDKERIAKMRADRKFKPQGY